MGILKQLEIENPGMRLGTGVKRGVGVTVEGDEELLADMERYFSNAESHEKTMVASITNALMQTTQTFSPYLTGTLRTSHRAEITEGEGEAVEAQGMFTEAAELISRGGAQETGRRKSNTGTIHLDPTAWNEITQGAPYIYGEKIHSTSDPWFEKAVDTRAGEIVAIHGGELVSWWKDVLPGNIA